MSPQYLRTLTTVFTVVVLGLIVSSCSDGYPAPSEQAMQEVKKCKAFGGDTRISTWTDRGVLKVWISCRKVVVISSQ